MTFHYLLMASHAIYNKKLMEMLSDTGLTAGQPKVLDYLGDYDGASQKEIAAHCYIAVSYTHLIQRGSQNREILDRPLQGLHPHRPVFCGGAGHSLFP